MLAKIYSILCRIEAVLAGLFLVLMVVLIFSGGVARMMGHPINWAVDIATCLFAWACFLCADIAWRNDALISIDLVTDRLSRPVRSALLYLNYALIAVFLIFLAYAGFYLSVISAARSFQGIPWISYSWVTVSLPVGALLLMLTLILKVRRLMIDGPDAGQHQPV